MDLGVLLDCTYNNTSLYGQLKSTPKFSNSIFYMELKIVVSVSEQRAKRALASAAAYYTITCNK